jgi:hypothetical protein
MLFHITMTHTADNCPAYHTENMPVLLASLEKLEALGRELNVKPREVLWGAPEHVAYAVVEAESLGSLGRFLNSIALTQDFKISPVQNVSDLIQFGKAVVQAKK